MRLNDCFPLDSDEESIDTYKSIETSKESSSQIEENKAIYWDEEPEESGDEIEFRGRYHKGDAQHDNKIYDELWVQCEGSSQS